jgi:hypothetical protein
LSSIEHSSLSPGQFALLAAHKQRWAHLRRSTARVDRARAEEGIALAYAAAGFSRPPRIVWGSGPIDIAQQWSRMPCGEAVGRNVRSTLIDRVRRDVEGKLRKRVNPELIAGVLAECRSPVADTINATVHRAVVKNASAMRPSLPALLDLLSQPQGLRLALENWSTFEASGCGQHDFEWLCAAMFFRDAFDLRDETAPLVGLFALANSVGWMLPYEHVCWLAERHDVLRHDALGRLHCADGPALAYPDGWAAYAWKGIPVPRALIEQPGRITVAAIEEERDVQIRRCMIEIITPERYIAEGAASRSTRDDCGTLWHKQWPDGDEWATVEVVNGTPEPDGHFKHYYLQVPPYCSSPREAVAWTYGMSEAQYMRLAVRS